LSITLHKILHQTYYLIKKEMLLEWRQKYALSGIVLYVAATIMVVYMSFNNNALDDATWVSLLWIILLFTSVNAVAKSFSHHAPEQQRYLYTLANPQAIILAKILYNVGLLLVISLFALLLYSVLLGNTVANMPLFLGAVVLGATGFSMCFTLMSAIASKANNSATLMAILSFPIVLPIVGLLIKISKVAIIGADDENVYKDINILLALDGIMLVLSFILFPFLWKD